MHQIEVSTKFLTNAMVTCTKVDCVFEVSSHALKIAERDKSSNKVKIHFIRCSNEYVDWRDAEQLANNE